MMHEIQDELKCGSSKQSDDEDCDNNTCDTNRVGMSKWSCTSSSCSDEDKEQHFPQSKKRIYGAREMNRKGRNHLFVNKVFTRSRFLDNEAEDASSTSDSSDDNSLSSERSCGDSTDSIETSKNEIRPIKNVKSGSSNSKQIKRVKRRSRKDWDECKKRQKQHHRHEPTQEDLDFIVSDSDDQLSAFPYDYKPSNTEKSQKECCLCRDILSSESKVYLVTVTQQCVVDMNPTLSTNPEPAISLTCGHVFCFYCAYACSLDMNICPYKECSVRFTHLGHIKCDDCDFQVSTIETTKNRQAYILTNQNDDENIIPSTNDSNYPTSTLNSLNLPEQVSREIILPNSLDKVNTENTTNIEAHDVSKSELLQETYQYGVHIIKSVNETGYIDENLPNIDDLLENDILYEINYKDKTKYTPTFSALPAHLLRHNISSTTDDIHSSNGSYKTGQYNLSMEKTSNPLIPFESHMIFPTTTTASLMTTSHEHQRRELVVTRNAEYLRSIQVRKEFIRKILQQSKDMRSSNKDGHEGHTRSENKVKRNISANGVTLLQKYHIFQGKIAKNHLLPITSHSSINSQNIPISNDNKSTVNKKDSDIMEVTTITHPLTDANTSIVGVKTAQISKSTLHQRQQLQQRDKLKRELLKKLSVWVDPNTDSICTSDNTKNPTTTHLHTNSYSSQSEQANQSMQTIKKFITSLHNPHDSTKKVVKPIYDTIPDKAADIIHKEWDSLISTSSIKKPLELWLLEPKRTKAIIALLGKYELKYSK